MKSTLFGGTFKVRSLVAGLVLGLLPALAQAAVNTWTNSGTGDGLWATGVNWKLGAAPSSTDNNVYITNAVSKTVTINDSTPAGNLTVSNLVVEAPSGATNTLLLSGNTTPLVCVSVSNGVSLSLGDSAAGKVGALVVDGGSLVTTNDWGNAITKVGALGTGIMTVSNGTWQGNQLYLGYNNGNGTLNLIGGTNSFGFTTNGTGGQLYIGSAGGSTGTVDKIGGLLVTTNGAWTVGYNGYGNMTASGGVWYGYAVNVAGNSGQGVLNLIDGTNQFFGNLIIATGPTGSVSVTRGKLVVTNGAAKAALTVGKSGVGNFEVTNAQVIANSVYIGDLSGRGSMTVVGGQLTLKDITLGNAGNGTLNLYGATTTVTSVVSLGCASGGVGTLNLVGGYLSMAGNFVVGNNVSFNCAATISNNATLMCNVFGVGNISSGNQGSNRVTIAAGGQVLASSSVNIGKGTNDQILVLSGGLLETAGGLWIDNTWATGNVISNSGGIYQFAVANNAPISPGLGAIVINGGTISYRNLTGIDIRWNRTDRLTNMVWTAGGANAFRLNNSTNITSGQNYIFAANSGSTNYARLELVNGNTHYQGGAATIGTGGSILFSNTVATVSNLTLNVAGAALTMVGSTVTNIGALVLGEDSVITINSNSVMNVGGALSVPTNAIFNLTGGIDRNAQVTLFNAASIGGAGSSANWTVLPATHRVKVVGTSLVIAPRAQGFIIKVQ
jgi:hypothetical protein